MRAALLAWAPRMEPKDFYPGLALTTLFGAVLLGIQAYFLPVLQEQWPFLAACLGVFAVFCVLTYFSARPAARAKNQARLVQYVLGFTFVKMMVGLGLVYGYYLLGQPPGRWFLLPFFTAYFIYTVFETIYLVKLNTQAAARQ